MQSSLLVELVSNDRLIEEEKIQMRRLDSVGDDDLDQDDEEETPWMMFLPLLLLVCLLNTSIEEARDVCASTTPPSHSVTARFPNA